MANKETYIRDTAAYIALVALTKDFGERDAATTIAHALLQFCKDKGLEPNNVISSARARFLSDPVNRLKVAI